jgi:hypothetical protein
MEEETMRYGGQVVPRIPPTAPLELRLPAEVYALDGVGACGCGCSPMGATSGSPVTKFIVIAAVIGGALWLMNK